MVHFQDTLVPFVEKLTASHPAAREEVLSALADFTNVIQEQSLQLPACFRYAIQPLRQITEFSGGNFSRFRSTINLINELILALHNIGDDTELTLQKGLSILPQSVGNDLDRYQEVLKAATRLAREKHNPYRFIEFSASTCQVLSNREPDDFFPLCHAFEKLVRELSQRGVGFSYPFASGLLKTAQGFKGDSKEFLSLFPGFLELIDLIRSHGYQAYRTFEEALPLAFKSAATAEDRKIVMDCALSLASLGVLPDATLSISLPKVLECEATFKPPLLHLLLTLSEKGISTAPFFENLQLLMLVFSYTDAELEKIFEQLIQIHIKAAEANVSPSRIFTDGMRFTERELPITFPKILDFILATIQPHSDPGYILSHGLSVTLRLFEKHPDLIDEVLAFARQELENQINPVALLGSACRIAKDVCKSDPSKLLETIQAQHRLILALKKDAQDPRRLFEFDLSRTAEKLGAHPESFLKLISQLESYVASFQDQDVGPIEALRLVLSVMGEGQEAEPVFKTGGLVLKKLRNTPYDSQDVFEKLLSLLLQIVPAGSDAEPMAQAIIATFFQGNDLSHVRLALDSLKENILPKGLSSSDIHTILASLQSLSSSPTIRSLFTQNVLPALLEGNPDFKNTVNVIAEISGLSFSNLSFEEQERFCSIMLPLFFKKEVGSFSLSKEIWEKLIDQQARQPKSLAASELYSFYSRLMDKCRDFSDFLQSAPRLSLSFLNGPETQDFPLDDLGRVAARHSESSEGFVQLFNGFVKEIEPAFYAAPSHHRYVFDYGFPLIGNVSAWSGIPFFDCFKTMVQLVLANSQAAYEISVLIDLHLLSQMFEQHPKSWNELISHLPHSQGRGSRMILQILRHLQGYIQCSDDLAVLKQITTQYGVRAPEILNSLIRDCLETGMIKSLAEDKATIFSFIDEIGFNDSEVYGQYASIQKESSLSAAERSRRSKQLRHEIQEMTDAIIAGEVREELTQNPAFFRLLYFVFPPSYSTHSDAHRNLFLSYTDHSSHIDHWNKKGVSLEQVYRFSAGAYVIREGEQIQCEAWANLVEGMNGAQRLGQELSLAEQGRELFQHWVQNDFTPKKRMSLIARIYQHYLKDHDPLPMELENPQSLLKLKSFAEDSAQEIIHASLAEHYAADPATFISSAQHKITPVKKVGKGLLKALQGTLDAYRSKKLDFATTEQRLRLQLKGFDCDKPGFISSLCEAAPAQRAQILESLTPIAQPVDPVQVYIRVFSDLLGDWVATMKRELFGDGKGQAAKVEFLRTADGGSTLDIRFQVTKKKAHAPIGLCEGVCTASDHQLWNRTEFMQVAFWGPDRQAWGGMHFLVAELDGKKFLTLPGINPTLPFLKRVQGAEILQKSLDFAKHMAREWEMEGVLIPVEQGIHSNRAEIQSAIQELKLPVRDLGQRVPFSYSPYSYSFASAYEVP